MMRILFCSLLFLVCFSSWLFCCYDGTTTKSTCYFYLAEGLAAAQKHGENGANKNNSNETAKDEEEEVWQGASFLDDQDVILLYCDLCRGV
jgi:hypothetical protein